MHNKFLLSILILLCAACGSPGTSATVAPTSAPVVQQATPTATATTAVAVIPANTPVVSVTLAPTTALTTAVTNTATNTDWVNTASVDGDFFVRGNPNAPIRMIDYSDFL